MATLVLGGGCFWCLEAVFVRVKGVTDVESAYCNGHVDRPRYEQVCTGLTGHAEVVKLTYDPDEVPLTRLLEIFFLVHDPTTLNRQGHDVGTQYRSGIYCLNESDLKEAQAFVKALDASGHWDAAVVTEVEWLRCYWPAEDYHQDYFEQHPQQGYCAHVVAPKVAKFLQTYKEWSRP